MSSFQPYRGSVFMPWLLPIIPIGAKLTPLSDIKPENIGKIPGKFEADRMWRGFAGWNALRPIEEGVLHFWDSWYFPKPPIIGIRAWKFPSIDLDVLLTWQALTGRDIAFKVFGETCVRSRTGSPRQLLMYSSPLTKSRHQAEPTAYWGLNRIRPQDIVSKNAPSDFVNGLLRGDGGSSVGGGDWSPSLC